uniref:Uncharacterized protein n=1 Tax=Minutocellus polymorphus TaxID=265543 RepID=A0A7S0AGK6_9STRA|mmetsp:Transcript_13538/g.22534  ORF Transcript_13538/g.22534 Transcript_13538/m.22534 type:complete len:179 (+) Transcript_13538:58-594(+)
MRRALLVAGAAAPGAAAWLSNGNIASYHMGPLHLPSVHVMSLYARIRDGDEDDEPVVETARKTLEKAYKRVDNFEALMDDDAILFLRVREEGTSVLSDDFLTTSAGIQIGLWAEELEVCKNREDCEQCEIPDDFKLPLTSQPMDVMSFLGIQRAKPLARKGASSSSSRFVDRTDDDWA